ncbi:pentatricopeptide repeat-containing family protein [Hibiscus syriacus]|uniref:Pentatricopeptide repeat-containing family protein n=1 Tax=Hibiscus syriacus TaxID=106335 RepID=A0A6A3B2W2_HIBSY|nr:pentatricopeptide repeat-containing family protein [Hibiscus syriacus]
MYYLVTFMLKAVGGFGGLRINSRPMIPVPYDWFNKGHTNLKKILDSGRNFDRADGVHINGEVAKGDGKNEPLFTMEAGKTYRYRICNAGLKTSLNFMFQGHTMKLVDMEGSHSVQNDYESLDVHVGQCYTVLVMADKETRDCYVVASSRFTKRESTTMGIILYLNGKGGPSSNIPKPPVGWAWSLNQFRTFRWNLTASVARPNPQGSYKYGGINITEHYGVADKFFKYNNIPDEPPAEISKVALEPILLNMTHKSFVEIIFENPETAIQSWHIDGYAVFAVAQVLEPLIYLRLSEIWDIHYLVQQLYISLLSPNRSVRDEYNLPDGIMTCGVVEGMPRPPQFID